MKKVIYKHSKDEYHKQIYHSLKPMTGYINLKRIQSYNKKDVWNSTFNVKNISKLRSFLKEYNLDLYSICSLYNGIIFSKSNWNTYRIINY